MMYDIFDSALVLALATIPIRILAFYVGSGETSSQPEDAL